jgi:hypothetical protein
LLLSLLLFGFFPLFIYLIYTQACGCSHDKLAAAAAAGGGGSSAGGSGKKRQRATAEILEEVSEGSCLSVAAC